MKNMPKYKYAIGFVDYDGEYIDGQLHGTGGPYLALLEWDQAGPGSTRPSLPSSWVEVDRWNVEGVALVEHIAAWEDEQ